MGSEEGAGEAARRGPGRKEELERDAKYLEHRQVLALRRQSRRGWGMACVCLGGPGSSLTSASDLIFTLCAEVQGRPRRAEPGDPLSFTPLGMAEGPAGRPLSGVRR